MMIIPKSFFKYIKHYRRTNRFGVAKHDDSMIVSVIEIKYRWLGIILKKASRMTILCVKNE
ncbi:hypothetical protein HMPREF0496_2050 [Lentilactobacillus hilgardii ATCC 27305]|nr:hypothetical protein HMPREF0496_2050 [Lentilactobacillus hilgardii ATCC 27305]